MSEVKGIKESNVLSAAIKSIERKFGSGSLMKLGSKNNIQHIESIPTGSLSLDLAIGVGGVPKGRIIEIYGPESSGKTTCALSVVAQAQKANKIAVFIDVEHALDLSYAKKLGVDVDNLYVSQPSCGEEALEMANDLVSTGEVGVVVIDSVAALVTKGELDGTMEDSVMGAQARLMSKCLRKMTAAISKTGTIVIFINQIRMKIGVMFGSPETTSGGQALKFFSSVRLDVRKLGNIMNKEKCIGSEIKIKVVKNKVGSPFGVVKTELIYGVGFDKCAELVLLSESFGITTRSGAWYSYKGERMAQGKENFKNLLKENTALADEIEKAIREKASKESCLSITTSSEEDLKDPFSDDSEVMEE